MDDSLTSFTLKGRRQWTLQLPASLTCMELLHHRPRSFKAVLVALQNREIRIYKDKFLVNCITMDVSNWRENPVIWSQSHTLTHTHTHTHTHTQGCGGGSEVWAVWQGRWSPCHCDPAGSPDHQDPKEIGDIRGERPNTRASRCSAGETQYSQENQSLCRADGERESQLYRSVNIQHILRVLALSLSLSSHAQCVPAGSG